MSNFDFKEYMDLCEKVEIMGEKAEPLIIKAAGDYVRAAIAEIERLLNSNIEKHKSYWDFKELSFASHCDIIVDGRTARFEDSDGDQRFYVCFDHLTLTDPVSAGKEEGRKMFESYEKSRVMKNADKETRLALLRKQADDLENEIKSEKV